MIWKIFISHSVHEDADKLFMDELIQRLRAEKFTLYSDIERINLGNLWRNEIYSAIGSCNAAVVLITRQALKVEEHPWVFHECSMFTLLKWAHKTFPIFAIRMDGVTLEDIERSVFNELQITEIQMGSHEKLDLIFETITNKCREFLDDNEPLYYYHKRIANHLGRIKDIQSLEDIIRNIDCRLDSWDLLGKEIPYRLARLLLLLESEHVVDFVEPILPVLRVEGTQTLINLLAPFWLELPAIVFLENKVQNDQKVIKSMPANFAQEGEYHRVVFGLQAKYKLIAELYISRAGSLKKSPYNHFEVIPDGENSITRIFEQMYAGINRLTGLNFRSDEPRLNKLIIEFALRKPVFVIVHHNITKDIVQRLRNRFWPFIFVVLIDHRDNPAEWNDIIGFEMLKPSLEEIAEDNFLLKYMNANSEAIARIPG